MIEKHVSRLYPICYYIGIVIIGLGAIQYIPILVSAVYAEWEILYDFVISSSIALIIGGSMMLGFGKYKHQRLSWGEGMIVAAWFMVCGHASVRLAVLYKRQLSVLSGLLL